MTKEKQITIKTSENDSRLYKYLELPNKLKVVLVSDDQADLAAAALNVNVGSAQDPQNRLGMAHFLEHMLFLGTEKYPEPDDYNSFITKHGGHYNAYTSFEHTNYFFDIEPSYFEQALDRFSQFFIAPLFSQKYLEREQNAVNSEYQTYVGNDDINQMYVMKELANQQHPFSKFNIGSLDTLASTAKHNVRDDVIDFYQQYYSANLMTLVLVSKQSLESLEALANKFFGAIINNNNSIAPIDIPIFDDSLTTSEIQIKPKKDSHDLDIFLPIPATWNQYKSKPYNYLSHFIGHEDTGSLLAWLKEHGLANSLGSGTCFHHRDSALFNISIELTTAGVKRKDEIITKIFGYIGLVEREGIQQEYAQEIQQLAANDFRFQERGSTMRYALTLANDLHYYPAADLLTAPAIISEYSAQLIKEAAATLNIENAVVIISTPTANTNKQEKWFNINYAQNKLSEQLIAATRNARELNDPDLILPELNLFIAQNFSLAAQSDDSKLIPEQIYQQQNIQSWHKTDTTFAQPRADIYLKFAASNAHDTALHSAMTQLYIRLCDDKLDQETYQAQLAGFEINLHNHPQGFSLKISGFTDKQDKLIEQLLDKIRQPEFTDTAFTRIKQAFSEHLANQVQESPYQQAIHHVSVQLIKNIFTHKEINTALEQVTKADLEEFIQQLYNNSCILNLVHGNYTGVQVQKLNEILRSKLANTNNYQDSEFAVLQLTPGNSSFYEVENEHIDSSVCLYVQVQNTSNNTKALVELLAHIIHTPLFEDLRTQQQLGYKVSAFSYPLHNTPGIAFTVESDVASAAKVYQQINAFLAAYTDELNNMSLEEFSAHKQGLITNIEAKAKNLTQQTDRYWRQLNRQEYAFDSREQLSQAVNNLSLQDMQAFYTQLVIGEEFGSLVTYSYGKQEGAAPKKAIA